MSTSSYVEKAREFLQKNPVAVLSTISSDGYPHSAVIFTIIDEHFNFFFITKPNTTKSKNIETNPKAALTFVDPIKQITVQARGLVKNEILSKDYVDKFLQTAEGGSHNGNPPLSILKDAGDSFLYKFEPNWLRYADFSENNEGQESGAVFHQIISNDK